MEGQARYGDGGEGDDGRSIALLDTIGTTDRTLWPARLAAAMRKVEAHMEISSDWHWPSLREMRLAWESMPLAERRVLLNGWSNPTPHARRSELLAEAAQNPPARRLMVTADRNGKVVAAQDYYLSCDTATVQVLVMEGKSCKEAVEALRKVLRLVENEWETLIAMRPSTDVFPFTLAPGARAAKTGKAKTARKAATSALISAA
jgi:hypothetical protein